MTLFPKVLALLQERGLGDVLVFGGGIIPRDDIPKLADAGIERIFTPGATTGEIVTWLHERLAQQQAS
jgi:methylmalonyl-CoA mutase C-terminal domain/subunit